MAQLIVVGASYHRAGIVREAATALQIDLVPLPGYSPDFMPVEALGSARMSPIITAIPPPRISADAWLLSRPASITTPSPTDSGSRITSIPTKKNFASQSRRGLGLVRSCAHQVSVLSGVGLCRPMMVSEVPASECQVRGCCDPEITAAPVPTRSPSPRPGKSGSPPNRGGTCRGRIRKPSRQPPCSTSGTRCHHATSGGE